MKKIYLITASFGSWDGHHIKIIKSFYNESDAIIYSKKYSRVMKSLSKFVNDVEEVIYKKEYTSDYDYDKCFYYSIWGKYHDLREEFNECIIEKITIE